MLKRLAIAVMVPIALATVTAAWPHTYHSAPGTRSWPALLDAGDLALKLGDGAVAGRPAVASARRAYLDAFFEARAVRSASGMVDAAERFAALGDREVASQCLTAARVIAKQDPTGLMRIDAVTRRLASAAVVAQ